jgi:hypothetical protein
MGLSVCIVLSRCSTEPVHRLLHVLWHAITLCVADTCTGAHTRSMGKQNQNERGVHVRTNRGGQQRKHSTQYRECTALVQCRDVRRLKTNAWLSSGLLAHLSLSNSTSLQQHNVQHKSDPNQPHPSPHLPLHVPRLYCALSCSCLAAASYQRAALARSCSTPSPLA